MKNINDYIKSKDSTIQEGSSQKGKSITSYIKGYVEPTYNFERTTSIVDHNIKQLSGEWPQKRDTSLPPSMPGSKYPSPSTVDRDTYAPVELSSFEDKLRNFKKTATSFAKDFTRDVITPVGSVLKVTEVLDAVFEQHSTFVEQVISGQVRDERRTTKEINRLPLLDRYSAWKYNLNTEEVVSFDTQGRPLGSDGKYLLYDKYTDSDAAHYPGKSLAIVQPYSGLETSGKLQDLVSRSPFSKQEEREFARSVPEEGDPSYESWINSKAYYEANTNPFSAAFIKNVGPFGEQNLKDIKKWWFKNARGMTDEEADVNLPEELSRDVTLFPMQYQHGTTLGQLTKMIAVSQAASVAIARAYWPPGTISSFVEPLKIRSFFIEFGLAKDAVSALPIAVEVAIDRKMSAEDGIKMVASRLITLSALRALTYQIFVHPHVKSVMSRYAPPSGQSKPATYVQIPENVVSSRPLQIPANLDVVNAAVVPSLMAEEFYALPDLPSILDYIENRTQDTILFEKVKEFVKPSKDAYLDFLKDKISVSDFEIVKASLDAGASVNIPPDIEGNATTVALEKLNDQLDDLSTSMRKPDFDITDLGGAVTASDYVSTPINTPRFKEGVYRIGEPGSPKLGTHITNNPILAEKAGIPLTDVPTLSKIKNPIILDDTIFNDDVVLKDLYNIMHNSDADDYSIDFNDFKEQFNPNKVFDVDRFKKDIVLSGTQDRFVAQGYDALILPVSEDGVAGYDIGDRSEAKEIIIFDPVESKPVGGEPVDTSVWNHKTFTTDVSNGVVEAYRSASSSKPTYNSSNLVKAVMGELVGSDTVLSIGGHGYGDLSTKIADLTDKTGVSLVQYNPSTPNKSFTFDNLDAINIACNGCSDVVVDNGMISSDNGRNTDLIHDVLTKAQNAIKPGGNVYISTKGTTSNGKEKIISEVKKRFPGEDNVKVKSDYIKARQYRFIDDADGNRVHRFNYDVGMKVRDSVYMDSNNALINWGKLPDYRFSNKVLRSTYGNFHVSIIGHDTKSNKYHFVEVDGFNSSAEPIIKREVTVSADGTVEYRWDINEPIKHKWAYVKDNYHGFNVDNAFGYSRSLGKPINKGIMNSGNVFLGHNIDNIDYTNPVEVGNAITGFSLAPDYENNPFNFVLEGSQSTLLNSATTLPKNFSSWDSFKRKDFVTNKLSSRYVHALKLDHSNTYTQIENEVVKLVSETDVFTNIPPVNIMKSMLTDILRGKSIDINKPSSFIQLAVANPKNNTETVIGALQSIDIALRDALSTYTIPESLIPTRPPSSILPALGETELHTGMAGTYERGGKEILLPSRQVNDVINIPKDIYALDLPTGYEYMPDFSFSNSEYVRYVEPMILLNDRFFQLPADDRAVVLSDLYADIAISNISKSDISRLYNIEQSLPEPLGGDLDNISAMPEIQIGRKLKKFISDIYNGNSDDPMHVDKFGPQYEIAKEVIVEYGYTPPAYTTLEDKETVFTKVLGDYGATSSTAKYSPSRDVSDTTLTSGGGDVPPIGTTSGQGFEGEDPQRIDEYQETVIGDMGSAGGSDGGYVDISHHVKEYGDGKFSLDEDTLMKFMVRMVDDLHPLRETVPTAYIKAFRSRQAGGYINHILTRELVDMKGKPLFKPYGEIYKGFKKNDFNDFSQYLIYKRAQDIYVQNAELLDYQNDINDLKNNGLFKFLSPEEQRAGNAVLKQKPIKVFPEEDGITMSDIVKSIDHFENHYKPGNPANTSSVDFKKTSEDYYRFMYLLGKAWYVDTGVTTLKAFDAGWAKNPHYAEFRRDVGKADKRTAGASKGAFVNRGSPIKKMVGSERPIMNPVTGAMLAVSRAVKLGLELAVGQEIVSQVIAQPDVFKDLFEIVPTTDDLSDFSRELNTFKKSMEDSSAHKYGKYDDEGYMAFGDEMVDKLYALQDQFSNMRKLSKQSGIKDSIVTVLVDGEPVKLKVHDPFIYDAVTNLSPSSRSALLRASGQLVRVFKLVTTGTNPVYSLTRNLVRNISVGYVKDVYIDNPAKYVSDLTLTILEMASFYSPKINTIVQGALSGLDTKAYKRFEKLLGNVKKGLKDGLKVNSIDLDSKTILQKFDPKQFNDYLATGGGFGTSPITSGRDALQHELNKMAGGGLSVFKRAIGGLEQLSDVIESSPRYLLFKNAIEAGMSLDQAHYMGCEIINNYHRKGYWSREADMVIPYFGSRIAGVENFVRTFLPTAQKSVIVDRGSLDMPSGGGGKEPPKGDLGVYDGDTYTGPKTSKSALKAFIGITIPALILWAWRKVSEEEQAEETGHAKANKYIDQSSFLIPIGDGKVIRAAKAHGFSAVFSTLPTAVLDSIFEKDPEALKDIAIHLLDVFTPPIRPVWAPVTDVLAGEQGQSWANKPIVSSYLTQYEKRDQYDTNTSSLAIVMGRWLNVSPKKVDYLFDSTGGWIADFVLPLLSMDTKGMDIGDKASTLGRTIIQTLESQVVTDLVYSTDTVSKYYDRLTELEAKYSSFKDRGGKMNEVEAVELMVLREANKNVSIVNKVMRGLREPGMPDAETIAAAEELTGMTYDRVKQDEIQRALKVILNKVVHEAEKIVEEAMEKINNY